MLALAVLSTARPVVAQTKAPGDTHPARRNLPEYELEIIERPWLPDWASRPLDSEHMFGDWNGLRTALQQRGITPSLTFVMDVQGNPVGGERHGFRQFNNLGADLDFDLAALAGVPGGRFHISAALRSGTSLTDLDIGNLFNVSQVCCGAAFWLVDVYYQQSLLDDRLSVRLGRISAGDEFLSSPFYWMFLQTGIDGNPEGIFFNTKGMTAYPVATWGIRARAKPTDDVYVMAAVFNGDPTLGEIDKHGVDWSLSGRPFAMFEAGYYLNQGRGATGLPGNYKVGAYYDGSTFTEFTGAPIVSGLPTRTVQGNFGFYVLADQMVYREGGADSSRGLTPFVSLLVAPNADINTFPLFVTGGLVYQGPLRSRAQDAAGFGVVYGKFSHVLQQAQRAQQAQDPSVGVQKYEMALEWFYLIQATRWLTIQPDVQYIIKPGGTGQIPNALVLGFQMAVSF